MASKRTGRGTVLFGLLVLLAGLAGAVVLYLLSQQRDDDAIRDLARATVGCETTMTFKDTGTFYVYIEHLGRLEALDGECDVSTDEYSRDPEDDPVVEITVLDADQKPVELDRVRDEFTYSLDDEFAGTARRQVEIESKGDYVVNVDSVDNDFVVAVGRDPANAGDTARLGALASGIAGIVLGPALVLLGVRRRRRARRLATVYTAEPGWPVGAPLPTAPPMTHAPLTQRMPAPTGPDEWRPGVPSGPPVVPSGPPAVPSGQALPSGPSMPARSPFAPPQVFAPPDPSSAHERGTTGAPRGEDGDVRGDASP